MANTATHKGEADGPVGSGRVERARYRPVRLIGLLLILEAAGLVGVMALEFSQVRWWIQVQRFSELSRREIEALASTLFLPTAALAVLAALSLIVFARRGWFLASVSQGAGLATCLWLTSETEPEPVYVYPIMVSCILIILYLNSRTVRALFQPGEVPTRRSRRP